MLAEVSASSITEVKNPQTYKENMQCAFDGGSVAAVARQSLEKELGLSVVSSLNALSTGQALLLDMFATIIRYGEKKI